MSKAEVLVAFNFAVLVGTAGAGCGSEGATLGGGAGSSAGGMSSSPAGGQGGGAAGGPVENDLVSVAESTHVLDVDEGDTGQGSFDVQAKKSGSLEVSSAADWLTLESSTLQLSAGSTSGLGFEVACSDNQTHEATIEMTSDGPAVELRVVVHCWGGPLVIEEGGTFSGNWQSLDGDVHAVEVKSRDPVELRDCRLRGRGPSHLIKADFVDLEVRNCFAFGMPSETKGIAPPRFIRSTYPQRLVVENNWIEQAGTTVYVENSGNDKPVEEIVVRYNQVRNIDGRTPGAKGCDHPFYGTDRAGTGCATGFFSMNRVDGAHVEVAWNEVLNTPYEGSQDVVLSTINSRGSAEDPIEFHDNLVWGQYPEDPATQESYGTGIIAADSTKAADAAKVSRYVWVYDNHIINTVKAGLGTVAGNTQRIVNNRVISSGKLPDGEPFFDQSGGAIAIWDCCYDHIGKGLWYDLEVSDNVFGWQAGSGDIKVWVQVGDEHCTKDDDGKSQCRDNTVLDAPITAEDEQAEYQRWLDKVSDESVALGPQ